MIIINHKSNLNIEEIIEYEKNIREMDVIIMPTLCYLPIFKGGKYKLGSQDISEFKEKARTGEINGDQLKSMNVKYNMIGHSERRRYNEESDETMTIKFQNCFFGKLFSEQNFYFTYPSQRDLYRLAFSQTYSGT